jgi:chromate reductase, NAD(P)H dehydrogenase (quinone)
VDRARDRDGDGIYEVAAIVGSLRRASLNRGLLRAAIELKPEPMRIAEVPIRDLPLFNEDIEQLGDPAPVRALKEGIRAADAVLIFTPEFNQSLPGVVKNALDWASRPLDGERVLAGKPVAMLGAAAGPFGTARAQLQLRQLLPHLGMYLLPKPEIYVARAEDKFDAAGALTDEPTRDQIRQLLTALLDWTRLIGSAG